MIKENVKSVLAFAPATSANVIVGFDILGFAMKEIGDEVKLILRNDKKLQIIKIESEDEIPYEAEKNLVTQVISDVLKAKNIPCGFDVEIKKGIAVGSGMGGSAASIIAALVALNAFLENPLANEELINFAAKAEGYVSGASHSDNVIPSLNGGFNIIYSLNPIRFKRIAVSKRVKALVIHPHIRIDTALSRKMLKTQFPLKSYVEQSAKLTALITALITDDTALLENQYRDNLISVDRKLLIPHYDELEKIAFSNNAFAFSISGSGPSLLLLSLDDEAIITTQNQMAIIYKKSGIAVDFYRSDLNAAGAKIKEVNNDSI